ncbi:Peptidase family M28 [Robiginitalea myxolifaciens]|uniref:Vacuolar membrane protease n=1 Tax=Robiginitalea myxolifaciens TaxID=400055 RepID=A0A1I6FXH4_9FLAO|nr:M28 family peptidase [Robiginitalea myxolifaciens]SFR34616.1 Peptidase family M28 [Robiginitalea myxolifaciens]
MKNTAVVSTLLLLVFLAFWAFDGTIPRYAPDGDIPAENFSTDRAMDHVKAMSAEPHAVGFPNHSVVRDYIRAELEKLGLETTLQSGYTAGDWANLSKAENILARIPGSGQGKALLLLSHYDSSPHSSFGASDAGSGVATILEGLRAYLSTNPKPVNDIIVLISDAEELGLNGADLFVNQHPWTREVGLVLNFEARGSGGASFMLIETNRGNARMIEEFVAADPEFPVGNSLAYSIYKMLPNDTDLTVFREDADIEGFNFAFIGDHFDYHTALDRADRLDTRTLAHQGSYLMPLLNHFAQADLGNLKSLNDQVYFNMAFFKLITYPYDWIWLMWAGTVLLFIILLISGFRSGALSLRGVLLGFVPALLCLVINGLAGHFAWPLLTKLYPDYTDMLHGFTYNGYYYIAAIAALAIGMCFLIYNGFAKLKTADALVGPMVLWLAICGLLNSALSGAAFFLIPGLSLLAGLWISMQKEEANPYILALLALPVLWIFAPFIKVFPVGLGLKLLSAASIMSVFIFLLLLGLLHRYPNKKLLGGLGMLLFVLFMVGAHFNSSSTPERPKPTSLLYVLNTDSESAYWTTYDQVLTSWSGAYFKESVSEQVRERFNKLSSKYGSGFSKLSPAPLKTVLASEVKIQGDTTIDGTRNLKLSLVPRRAINRLEIYTNETELQQATVNGIELSEYFLENRSSRLITHYVSDNDSTYLDLSYPADQPLELTLYEASNDLLDNPQFSVPPRPETEIPKPFVLNDAVMTIQTLSFE